MGEKKMKGGVKGRPDPNSRNQRDIARKKKNLQKAKAVGLGDTVENIMRKTGIKAVVNKLFDKLGKDCGCDKRKEKLNKMFRYPKVSCMSKEQFVLWTDVKKRFETDVIKDPELKIIARLHSQLFNHKYEEPCRCEPKAWKQYILDIERLYETYQTETVK